MTFQDLAILSMCTCIMAAMEVYEYPWIYTRISLGINERPWGSMENRGYSLIYTAIHGYPHGCSGISIVRMDIHGHPWRHMEIHGNDIWTFMHLHGYQWAAMDRMDINEFQWITMDRIKYTRIWHLFGPPLDELSWLTKKHIDAPLTNCLGIVGGGAIVAH